MSTTMIEIGMYLHVGHPGTHDQMWFCGEGTTEEEAMAEFVACVRRNNLLSRRFGNGSRFTLDDLKTLPENILPETHGLLVVDEGRHGIVRRGSRRLFLIRKGTRMVIVHSRDSRSEVVITDEPNAVYHDDDENCEGYRLSLPRGSLELVDGAWIARPEGVVPRLLLNYGD